jgi:hypothetical protein
VVTADPDLALGTDWERDPVSGLWLSKARRNFPVAVADAKASPPVNWTWRNSGAASSSNVNTTTANAWRINHGNTSTDLWGGTYSCPAVYKLLDRVGRHYETIARWRTSANQNYEYAFHGVVERNGVSQWARINGGESGFTVRFQANSGTVASVTASSQILQTDGVWTRLVCEGAYVTGYYSFAVQATPPTSWTRLGSSSVFGTTQLTTPLEATFGAANAANPGGGFWAELHYWDDSACVGSPFDGEKQQTCGQGWKSGVEQYLVSACPVGTMSITDAQLQAALGAITNRRAGDSATLEWYAARHASADPGGTYRSAATALIEGSGAKLWIKWRITTNGQQPGSVAVDAFRLRAA